ncbi:MAG: hypothetical protein ACLURV_06185 [Gallintestinimicrobium sp.]
MQRLEAGRLCTAESEQLVQFDAGRGYGQKGSIEILLTPCGRARCKCRVYPVSGCSNGGSGGYTVLELTGGFEAAACS